MTTRATPSSAAKAFLHAAAKVTKALPQTLLEPTNLDCPIKRAAAMDEPKPDGRKQRWQQHKETRRTELVDGTLAAVRKSSVDLGMDEIAAAVGVSKTVLYRYFSDRSDLTTACMLRYVEVVLMPAMMATLDEELSEFELSRELISAYVNVVADDPNSYRFLMINSLGPREILGDVDKIIAQILELAIQLNIPESDFNSEGIKIWAYSIVGSVKMATHWWMSEKQTTQKDLIDHLSMMVWSSIVGIFNAQGRAKTFFANPPSLFDGLNPSG